MSEEKDDYDPQRPVWDKAKDGTLPERLSDPFTESAKIAAKQEDEWRQIESLTPERRLARLEAMEAEVFDLANSRAADLMTEEQRFINTWQKELTVAEASLRTFENPKAQVEDRAWEIFEYQRRAAIASYKLGRIEKALEYADSYPELVAHIHYIQTAKELPDDEFLSHPCPRQEANQDGTPIELDRRYNAEDVISEIHGTLVHLYTCTQCGLTNAVPSHPERQARYDAAMLATIHSLAKGDQPNAKGIIENPKLKQFEASVLLAKS